MPGKRVMRKIRRWQLREGLGQFGLHPSGLVVEDWNTFASKVTAILPGKSDCLRNNFSGRIVLNLDGANG